MSSTRNVLLLSACAAAFALPAAAQVEPNGFYIAGDVGYHEDSSKRAESSLKKPDGFTAKWRFNTDPDFAFFGRLGYRISPNWRVELEAGHLANFDGLESVTGSPAASQPQGLCRAGVVRNQANPNCQAPSGSFRTTTVMANVLFDLFPESSIRPYVGAGIGGAYLRARANGQMSGVPAGFAPYQNVRIRDEDTSLAYQALAGITWSATRRLSVDATYRALWSEHEFDSITYADTSAPLLQLGRFEREMFDQSVSLGLRYSFGAIEEPAPPVVPQPPLPPEPPAQPQQPVETPQPQTPVPQEFVVYFPFDQYVLTPEAQGVVQQAAAYAQQGTPTSVVIVGHTDTSGSQAYNVRLSERRAKAVADAMVGLGVNQAAMQVDWRGETQPAVATGDGVKEPLNRRTTIGVNF